MPNLSVGPEKYADEREITLLDATPYFTKVCMGKEKAIDVQAN
jgi:hypothetical protein